MVPNLDRELGTDELRQPRRVGERGSGIVCQSDECPAETHASGTRIGEAEL